MWLGLRGFPDVQGGVEAHAQHLCPLLAELGCEVTVLARSRYQPPVEAWRGVRFVRLWSPRSSRLEAVVHSFAGVLHAAIKRPDILHIHGIGPSLVVPLARMLGLRVVVTHHGPDYERQKWGRLAKTALRLGERWGMLFASQRIVITGAIQNDVSRLYGRNSVIIPNGVALPDANMTTATPAAYGVEPGCYVLLVGRLVPEKRHHDLIQAFCMASLPGWKLVIAGGADHPDAYSKSVLDVPDTCPGVICTGFLSGKALGELYAHAGVFVLPSSHEGLPIALLEAISHGIPVIASDIPANREVDCDMVCHYPLGDVMALAQQLRVSAACGITDAMRKAGKSLISGNYSWPEIARRTLDVYRLALDPPAARDERHGAESQVV
jgi:glycosyltransferase involved in cell wall biosynthesis